MRRGNSLGEATSMSTIKPVRRSGTVQKRCSACRLPPSIAVSNLTTLPKELTNLIIADLPLHALKSLRLSCTYFAFDKELLKLLYRKIVLTADRIHFREILEFTDCSHLAPLVEEFRFNCAELKTYQELTANPHQYQVKRIRRADFWADGQKSRLRYQYLSKQQLPVVCEDEQDTKFWLRNLQLIFDRLHSVRFVVVDGPLSARFYTPSRMPHFINSRLDLVSQPQDRKSLICLHGSYRTRWICRYLSAALISSGSYTRIQSITADWQGERATFNSDFHSTRHVHSYSQMFQLLKSRAYHGHLMLSVNVCTHFPEDSTYPDEYSVQKFKSSMVECLRPNYRHRDDLLEDANDNT